MLNMKIAHQEHENNVFDNVDALSSKYLFVKPLHPQIFRNIWEGNLIIAITALK
jgi:hypothetical protein